MLRGPVRRIFRSWPFLLLGVGGVLTWILLTTTDSEPSSRSQKWTEAEEEDVDHRGIRLVVGHYVGDVSNVGFPINLTDDMINTNHFNPLPYEGKDGKPVELPSREIAMMQTLYTINKFNLLASDRIPLNRTLPDVRKKRCLSKYQDVSILPTTSVILVFHNEAWSTLLRTVHSVINRSPRAALEEIILVDDASTRKFLGEELEKHVAKLSVPVSVLRTGKREGLVRARLMGARAAKGQVLTFLDAHCECTTGWLEPLLLRVAFDRTKVVCPVIDIINENNFAYVRSFELHWGAFNWNMHFRWFTLGGAEVRRRKLDIAEPFPTPAMAGGLFSIDKGYFFEVGSYDEKMEVWGGENLEMSFRVWQCGGSIEIAPCSHVGHLFRKSSPYTFPGGVGDVLYGNLARVAMVWMDEWQDFYFRFNQEAAKQRDKQSVRERIELRRKLKCQSFEWYLENVWPRHFFPTIDRFFGQIKSESAGQCLTKPQGRGNQPTGKVVVTPCTNELEHMFVKTDDGNIMTDESVCLDAPDQSSPRPYVKVIACVFAPRQIWTYNKNKKALIHNESKRCLEVDGENTVLAVCTGLSAQKWTFIDIPWRKKDEDHLRDCTALTYPNDDLVNRYWEARRRMVELPHVRALDTVK